MQQGRAVEARLGAQIQREFALEGFGLELQPLLFALEVFEQRRERDVGGDDSDLEHRQRNPSRVSKGPMLQMFESALSSSVQPQLEQLLRPVPMRHDQDRLALGVA